MAHCLLECSEVSRVSRLSLDTDGIRQGQAQMKTVLMESYGGHWLGGPLPGAEVMLPRSLCSP